jgi:hypothetical protein
MHLLVRTCNHSSRENTGGERNGCFGVTRYIFVILCSVWQTVFGSTDGRYLWDCFLPVASVQAYKFMALVYAGQLNKQRLSKPRVSQVNPRIGMYCR